MKFRCNKCCKEFTTISLKGGEKIAFSVFLVDKMKCPHCGAMNTPRELKPLKHTRSRWQPKRRSMETSDYPEPNVTLHEDCQHRLINGESGFRVMCEGCPSAFNCLTGNVDDGNGEDVDWVEARKKARIEEAKEKIKKIDDDKIKEDIKKLKLALGKAGLSCYCQNDKYYIKFCGTVWKLSEEDKQAIIEDSWHTPKTTVIKATLTNRNINLTEVRKLVNNEYHNLS